MTNAIRFWVALLLALCLAACASSASVGGGHSATGASQFQGQDYFPGGSPDYAQGVGQSFENFANVPRAQTHYSLFSKDRTWADFSPSSRASGSNIGLSSYFPLHVRWKLKDGREFILEDIDIRGIMREYFKSNDLKLQWQREGRPRSTRGGDYTPLLAHEVKDDTVRIKWVLRINRTPVEERFTSKGAATMWEVVHEEHIIATLKGKPTQDIDFDKKWEFNRTSVQPKKEQ